MKVTTREMKQFQIIYSIQMTLPFINGHDVSSTDDSDKEVDKEIYKYWLLQNIFRRKVIAGVSIFQPLESQSK